MNRIGAITALAVSTLIISAAGLAALNRRELQIAYWRWLIDRDDARERQALFDEWEGLGDDGWPIIEAIAFDDEVALPDNRWTTIRQEALDRVRVRDTGDEEFPRLEEDRLRRYLGEARGLSRDNALNAIYSLDDSERTVLRDAAELALLTDPNEAGSFTACLHLAGLRDPVLMPLLRRACRESPHPTTRRMAIGGLKHFVQDSDASLFRACLADPSEPVRVAAAWALADGYGDFRGTEILVAALRSSAPADLRVSAAIGLGMGKIDEPRAIEAMIDTHDDLLEHGERVPPLEDVVRRLTDGRVPRPDNPWRGWWERHRDEFPEQLDPEAMDIAPFPASRR